jgi:predicted ATP-dependent endonuclease of OLD family
MDEPDAYLSSQAQQDLLKIFESFAVPTSTGKDPIQVIYVTHSPFLIDKNHAERIRVLEKGASEEGTRVVKDAGRNHYEPLRSAFGAFVGETVFIGNTNLFVEGMSDQVILAGAANYIRKKSELEDETLDLNRLTIVPAGSASHIPYMVFLARGRDPEKPPIVVLLDSDTAGNDAKKALQKGGPRRKEVLPDRFILQLHDLMPGNELYLPTGKLSDIEDLIPIPLCVLAVKEYLKTFCD